MPGEFKDYYYPNQQAARFLWYHDHAFMHTAENAYFGMMAISAALFSSADTYKAKLGPTLFMILLKTP